MFPFQFVVAMLCGWLQRERDDVIAFLREENRVLKARSKDGGCGSTMMKGAASRSSAIVWVAGCWPTSPRL